MGHRTRFVIAYVPARGVARKEETYYQQHDRYI